MRGSVVQLLERLRGMGVRFWLSVCAGILFVILLTQGTRCTLATRLTPRLANVPLEIGAPPAREASNPVQKYDPIVKEGHLGEYKQIRPQLFGIIGDSALVGTSSSDAQLYTVGASLPGGAKLVELHPNSVVVEKESNRETLTLFPELPATGGSGKPGPPAPASVVSPSPGPEKK